MYTCVYISVSGAVYTPTRQLSVTGRRAFDFLFLLPTTFVSAEPETAAPPIRPSHIFTSCIYGEGGETKQRALAACMHTNL